MVQVTETLLQNIGTVTDALTKHHKIPTHPATQLIKDGETQITTDKFKELIGEAEKVSFSSGPESRDITRRADLLRKSVPSRRGGVCERSLTIVRYGQMDDGGQSCQNMSEADGKRCKQ